VTGSPGARAHRTTLPFIVKRPPSKVRLAGRTAGRTRGIVLPASPLTPSARSVILAESKQTVLAPHF